MMLHDTSRIKLALPNKGRLREPVIELLKAAGYKFRIQERTLYASCTNAEMTLIFIRAEDIPILVHSGVVELGITGQDLVVEKQADVEEILPLQLGRCRLCVAVKEDLTYTGPENLAGKTVATSFPHITREFFRQRHVDVQCLEMSGSLEIMVGLQLADAIVDLVETGDTLKENHLKAVEEIGKYQTVLMGHKKSLHLPQVEQIKRRLEGIIIARRYSMLEYNIKRELLSKAQEITPGFEAPTISELNEVGWLAVKVMVEKDKVIDTMDRLQQLGATAIIETEIKNCRL